MSARATRTIDLILPEPLPMAASIRIATRMTAGSPNNWFAHVLVSNIRFEVSPPSAR